jgi:hypothetical protein
MEIKTVEEVEALKKLAKKRGHGEVEYAKEVERLKSGEGFVITPDEWRRKTSIASYFSGKFNRKGVKVLLTAELSDGRVLVIKK